MTSERPHCSMLTEEKGKLCFTKLSSEIGRESLATEDTI
jgi:hypothetical protein